MELVRSVIGSGERVSFEVLSTIRDKDGLVITQRKQRARAELLPSGQLLCLWVSCPDVDWTRTEGPILTRITDSFEVL